MTESKERQQRRRTSRGNDLMAPKARLHEPRIAEQGEGENADQNEEGDSCDAAILPVCERRG